MGAEGHDPRTLFVQVSIDLHERQATPGEVAHTRHKPTILLARLQDRCVHLVSHCDSNPHYI